MCNMFDLPMSERHYKTKNDGYQSLRFCSTARVPWVSKCLSTWVPWVRKSIQSSQMWHNFESFSVRINKLVRNAVLMIFLFITVRKKLLIYLNTWKWCPVMELPQYVFLLIHKIMLTKTMLRFQIFIFNPWKVLDLILSFSDQSQNVFIKFEHTVSCWRA